MENSFVRYVDMYYVQLKKEIRVDLDTNDADVEKYNDSRKAFAFAI